MDIETRTDDFYTDFSCFIEHVLRERHARGLPVEIWLATSSALIGTKALPRIVRALGLGHLLGRSAISTALFPGLGAVAGVAAGLALSHLFSEKDEDKKSEISTELKKAEELFNSYNELDDEKQKRKYIDELFEDVVAGRRLVK